MSALEKLAKQVTRRGGPMPVCGSCDRSKYPQGRSVPMEVSGIYCSGFGNCLGYYAEPHADFLHPGELVEYVWVDAETVRDLFEQTIEGEVMLDTFKDDQ